jgi:AcrR family transcriptional regulator
MASNEPAPPADAPPAAAGLQWERRAAERVVDGSRDRLLARSRQFVDKARTLVARDGVDGLTLRAILQETGLSRRAFYERFASKDDLLIAVFEETMRAAAERIRADLAERRIADPLDRLRYVVARMIAGAASGAGEEGGGLPLALSREHLRLAEARPDELRHAVAPTTDLMAEQIEAAMREGRARDGDARELAALVHTLVSSTIHTALLGRETAWDGTRTTEVVWEFCRRALAA